MESAPRDPAACLTDAALDALEAASPGQAPEDLARHLAGCARCQDRVLVRARGATGERRREAAPRRSPWLSAAIVLGVMLLALVALLSTLLWFKRPSP
jgi:hypothetical protein